MRQLIVIVILIEITLLLFPTINTSSILVGHLLSEFSECYIDVIINRNFTGEGYDYSVPIALMKYPNDMEGVLQRFQNLKSSRRRRCELVFSNWTFNNKYEVHRFNKQFTWLTQCGFNIEDPIGSEPLCFSKSTYFIFIKYPDTNEFIPSDTIYAESIFEITLDNQNGIVVRALPTPICFSTVSTKLMHIRDKEVNIRGFLRDAPWILFQNHSACPWNIFGTGVKFIQSFQFLKNESHYHSKVRSLVHDIFRSQITPVVKPFYEIQTLPWNARTKFTLNMPLDLYRRKISRDSYTALKKQATFNFVTCHHDSHVSFLAFISPFKCIMWACVLATLVISTCFLHLYFAHLGLPINATFLVIRLILEHELDEVRRRQVPILRGFCLLLCLTFLLITNAYRGKLTTNLTAPLHPYQVKTIEEAVEKDFKVLTHYTANAPKFSELDESRRNIIHTSIDYGLVQFLSSLNRAILENNRTAIQYNFTFQRILAHQLILKGSDVNNQFVDSTFSLCQKIILIGEMTELKAFVVRSYKGKPSLNIYFGRDRILPTNLDLEISPTHWDKSEILKRRFGSFTTSGIFDHQFLFLDKIKQTFHHKRKIRQIKLKSNIVSLFIILISLISASIIVFSAEQLLHSFIFPLTFSFMNNAVWIFYTVAKTKLPVLVSQ